MAKQKFKITNWPTYNKALINRGSITFWLDDEAIQAWYESATPSSRGRPQRYSDLAITTVLVIKRVFRLTLRAAQGFIDSIFTLMNVPLRCPDYTSVSKRAKSVNVSFKTFTRGEIAHLVIDSTGLKVFGEGEWKVKKHGQERRRIWRKLHLAVDSNTHEIICADLSLNNVTDSEAFPGLIRQTHRKSGQHRQTALTTPGCVTMNCGVRKSAPLSRPEKVRVTGPVNMQTVTVLLRISE
ncbi:transposase [Klebsiella pneumoniae]|uniref:Transposase n=1 Tax=Klebsiella pneumoniae TaxID=573 RepID=A0A4P0YIG6_KLEPN|nr:transposase [Klebsiella pneumoniae]